MKVIKGCCCYNGQLKEEYTVNDKGQMHGEFKWWNKNGQLYDHDYYKDGELHGECKRWYENGQLEEHSLYEDDELVKDYLKK